MSKDVDTDLWKLGCFPSRRKHLVLLPSTSWDIRCYALHLLKFPLQKWGLPSDTDGFVTVHKYYREPSKSPNTVGVDVLENNKRVDDGFLFRKHDFWFDKSLQCFKLSFITCVAINARIMDTNSNKNLNVTLFFPWNSNASFDAQRRTRVAAWHFRRNKYVLLKAQRFVFFVFDPFLRLPLAILQEWKKKEDTTRTLDYRLVFIKDVGE